MRFVIYDEYLEPITVISLPGMTDRKIEEHGRLWRVPVPEPLSPVSWEPEEELAVMSATKIRVVDLKFEPIARNGIRGWMCFTKHDEWAVLLDSVLLPGQLRDQADMRRVNAVLTDALIKSAL